MQTRSHVSRGGSYGMGFGSFAMVGPTGFRLSCSMIQPPELEHAGVRVSAVTGATSWRSCFNSWAPAVASSMTSPDWEFVDVRKRTPSANQ